MQLKKKLKKLVNTLIQKTGIMQVFQPLLGLIFLIIGLVSGFPCKKKGTFDENCNTGSINVTPISFSKLEDDSSCCDEPFCPEILSDRSQAPLGFALVKKAKFGHCKAKFVFKMETGNQRVAELEPFQKSPEALNCLVDKKVKQSVPAGATGDRSTFKIRVITAERGDSRQIIAPVLDIDGDTIFVSTPFAELFRKKIVFYQLIPDYDMLVAEGIIGIGCHPDIREVQIAVEDKYDMTPVLEANPEVADLNNQYNDVLDEFNRILSDIANEVDTTLDIDNLNDLQNEAIALFNDFIEDLLDITNAVLRRNTDPSASDFVIDKDVVKADGTDFALITITPRDVSGSLIVKNTPNGTGVAVEIISSVGEVLEQTFNNANGTITAKLSSDVVGTSNVRVKINNELVDTVDDDLNFNVKIEQVKFVAEAALPIRRRRTKPSSKPAISTGSTSEKEPG